MDSQSASQLRLKPCRLRRHDVSTIGDIDDLLHREVGIDDVGEDRTLGLGEFGRLGAECAVEEVLIATWREHRDTITIHFLYLKN